MIFFSPYALTGEQSNNFVRMPLTPLRAYLSWYFQCLARARPLSAVDRAPDDPGFDTRSGNTLSFLLPLIQEGQLSVTGESMCTKYWLTA